VCLLTICAKQINVLGPMRSKAGRINCSGQDASAHEELSYLIVVSNPYVHNNFQLNPPFVTSGSNTVCVLVLQRRFPCLARGPCKFQTRGDLLS
jgi:hypothetical protein